MDHKKRATTYGVWVEIRKAHKDLVIFTAYSAPDGDYLSGNDSLCKMMTEYGFEDAECPLLGIETTWEKDIENPSNRINEKHNFWLCMPTE